MFKRLPAIPGSFLSIDGARLSPTAYLFLFILCFAFFIPGIVAMPPTDRDESSFAQASKQMIETGNYVDIRLQKEPRYKKPIGIYWLQTVAVRTLNPEHLSEIWAYRVPSFLGAMIAVLMTAALGTLLFGPEVGLFAAIMLAGCVLLNVEARLAKTDAALLACIVTVMYGMARAYIPPLPNPRHEREGSLSCLPPTFLIILFFWIALALGVLIKGPIILLPILSLLLWIQFSDKNIKRFGTLRPALGILFALLLIVPWFIAISMQSHGAFMQQSAGNDMLAKIWQGQNRGIMPPGLYLLMFPVTFFPFSIFALLALPDIWKNRRDASVKFCLGWIVPCWIIFELSLTKLPHYVLPTYPAIAILTAKFLRDGFPALIQSTKHFPVALIAGVWLIIGALFAFAFVALAFVSDHVLNISQIVAGIILITAMIMGLFFLPKHQTISLNLLAVGMLIFMAVIFGYTIPNLQHVWMSREIVSAADKIKPCPQSQIVTAGYHEPSLAFMAGTNTLMETNGKAAAEDLQEDACRIAAIDAKHAQEFLDAFAGAKQQPRKDMEIAGLNSGHGAQMILSFYVMPQGVK